MGDTNTPKEELLSPRSKLESLFLKGHGVHSSVVSQNGKMYQLLDGPLSPISKKKNSPLSNIKPLSPSQFSKSTRKALLMGAASGVGPFKMENNSD